MPTLSQYWFNNRFFAGPFDGWNQPYGGWAWISSGGASAATLVWNRQDNEQAFDLGADLQNPLVTNPVDGILPSGVTRTSAVKAAGVFWPDVPYYGRDPSRHNNWDMLVRVYFDFHIHTPWYCSDADGNISYWLVIYLDPSHRIRGFVDGWSYHYDGGGPFCTGSINSGLDSAVPGAIGTVQGLLDTAFDLITSTFSMIYFLPGSGTKAPGGFSENADDDVAIAALP